jgi:hypothetical protein
MLVPIGILLGGCTHTHAWVSNYEREADTGLDGDDQITIILSARDAASPSEYDESGIEACLSGAMLATTSGLKFVPAEEFRRAAFPGQSFHDAPKKIEDLLAMLSDTEHRGRLVALKIRYLLVVSVATKTTWRSVDPKDDFLGKDGTKGSELLVEVLDVKLARRAGQLGVMASGESSAGVKLVGGGGAGLLIPVLYFAATESKACDVLGREAAQFLANERS